MSISTHIARAIVTIAALGFCSLASAQATRTWVSGVGDDANPCSRTAPCKTFAGAISKTAAGGEISVLDPGGYGGVSITKSMTIDGGGFVASALTSGTNGIIVNGANVNVVLRNIQLHGSESGVDGVRFLNGKSLTLDNVKIQQYNAAAGNAVNFSPNAGTTTASLTILNSVFVNNGGATGQAILIKPTSPTAADVMIKGVTANQNQNGLRAENGSIVTIIDSSFSNNISSGVQAFSISNGNVQIRLDGVIAANNGTNGVRSDGSANAIVTISNSSISGNLTGVSPANGGQIISFKNNRIAGNVLTDGSLTGTLNQN